MKNKSKVLALLMPLFAPGADAALIGGFENGLSGWAYLGDVSVQNASIGLTPTQGLNMAFVSTMCDRNNPPSIPAIPGGFSPCQTTINEHPYSGVSSYPVFPDSYAASFLGLPSGYLDFPKVLSNGEVPKGESGALKISFSVTAPGTLSFDWNRIGSDYDSAYFSLWSAAPGSSFRVTEWVYNPFTFSGSFSTSAVDLCSRYYDVAPSHDCFGNFASSYNVETGWHTRSVAIDTPGTYWLGFGLTEIAEGTAPTVLALDNVSFTPAAVPEPSTYALLLLGLVPVLLKRSRRP